MTIITFQSVHSIITFLVNIESKDIYSQLFINGRVETILIKLNTKFEVDIINVLGATFFSSDIIEIFEREKITGYIKCKERLEN